MDNVSLTGVWAHFTLFQLFETALFSFTIGFGRFWYAKLHSMYKCVWIVLVLSLSPAPSVGQSIGLFGADSALQLVLAGDVRQLLNDRKQDPTYYSMALMWNTGSQWDTVQIRARTRGHFRRQASVCTYPPILLNFSKEGAANTLFTGQDKLKLVLPCQVEKYVMREYVVYQLYQQLTPRGFRARRVELQFQEKGRLSKPIAAILLEDEHEMAARNEMKLLENQIVKPTDTNPDDFLRMAMFQLMIGNTDWSVQYQQNVKLVQDKAANRPTPVPYDFDHSGIVSASYAKPAAELKLNSVRERRYRGNCQPDPRAFDAVIAEFQSKRESFFAVCRNAAYLDEASRKFMIGYLEDFFELLNNADRLRRVLAYPCDPAGTGNVIIKGMKP